MDLGRRPEARFPNARLTLLDREVRRPTSPTSSSTSAASATTTAPASSAPCTASRHPQPERRGRRRSPAVSGAPSTARSRSSATSSRVGKSILLLGRPGVGKTTMLREAARVLADELASAWSSSTPATRSRGDGDIPHPAIGRARRMQVPTPSAPARGDDRGGREPHARSHRHRRDRHGAGSRRRRAPSPSAACNWSARRTATRSKT